MAASVPASPQPCKVALVIGISKYPTPLANAANDAKEMGQKLRDLGGFNVVFLDDNNCKDRTQIIIGLDRFQRSLSPDSIVVFYYAGHGVVWQGKHYMMCTNFEVFSPASMCDAAGVCIDTAIKSISLAVPKGVVIALLDTCRVSATAGGRGLTRGLAAVTEDTRGIEMGSFDGEVLVGYACARTAAAQDGGKDEHGLYTKHLLQTIFDVQYGNIFLALGAANKAVKVVTGGMQTPQMGINDPTPFSKIRLVEPQPAGVGTQPAQPEVQTQTTASQTSPQTAASTDGAKVPPAVSPLSSASNSFAPSSAAAATSAATGSASPFGALSVTAAAGSEPAFCFGAPPSALSKKNCSSGTLCSSTTTPTAASAGLVPFVFGVSPRTGSEGLANVPAAQHAAGLAPAASAPLGGAAGTPSTPAATTASPLAALSVTELVKALVSPNSADKQEQVVRELCRRAETDITNLAVFSREPTSVSALIDMLASWSRTLRLSAALLLSKLCEEYPAVQTAVGTRDGVGKMFKLLCESETEGRAAVAKLVAAAAAQHEKNTLTFGRHGQLMQKLLQLLRDKDPNVRTYAAAALSHIVENADESCRCNVANSTATCILGDIGNLITLVDDSSPAAQKHAAAAMAYILRAPYAVHRVTYYPGFFDYVKKLLQRHELCHCAADMIVSMLMTTDQANPKVLKQILADGGVLESLVSSLHEPGLGRYYAALALEAAAATSSDVSSAILKTNNGAAIQGFISMLDVLDKPRSLISIGKEVYPDSSLCEVAARVLSDIVEKHGVTASTMIGQQGAIPKLVALLCTNDAEVKVAALRALKTLAKNNEANQNKIAQQPDFVPAMIALMDCNSNSKVAAHRLVRPAAITMRAVASKQIQSSIAEQLDQVLRLLSNQRAMVRAHGAHFIIEAVTSNPDNQTRVGKVPGLIKQLVKLAYRDSNQTVRLRAHEALRQMAAKHSANYALIIREAEVIGLKFGWL